MKSTESQRHWERVYGSRKSDEVSWFQPRPDRSLQLIRAAGIAADTPIIDVGGGASTLVDHLLDEGYGDVTVLDIAASAFEHSSERLGPLAARVEWIVADITRFEAHRSYGLWHDRAVLHFLDKASDRDRYVHVLDKALAPGACLILATFGPQGPRKCSGLEVRRYDVDMMTDLLGDLFELRSDDLETHTTPGGATQQFLYTSWTRRT